MAFSVPIVFIIYKLSNLLTAIIFLFVVVAGTINIVRIENRCRTRM